MRTSLTALSCRGKLILPQKQFTLQFEPQNTQKFLFAGTNLSTTMPDSPFDSLQTFTSDSGPVGRFYSLPQLEKNGVGPTSRLPHSIRVVLESVLRNCDGEKITEDDVRELANWQPNGK